MKWLKVSEVDWDDVFENRLPVLIYGKRFSGLCDSFIEQSGYACGVVRRHGPDGILLESLQGEVEIDFYKMKKVVIIE